MLCKSETPQILFRFGTWILSQFVSREISLEILRQKLATVNLSSEEALQLVAPLLQALLQTLLAAALDVLDLLVDSWGRRRQATGNRTRGWETPGARWPPVALCVMTLQRCRLTYVTYVTYAMHLNIYMITYIYIYDCWLLCITNVDTYASYAILIPGWCCERHDSLIICSKLLTCQGWHSLNPVMPIWVQLAPVLADSSGVPGPNATPRNRTWPLPASHQNTPLGSPGFARHHQGTTNN